MSQKIMTFSIKRPDDIEIINKIKEDCRKNYTNFSELVVKLLVKYYKDEK